MNKYQQSLLFILLLLGFNLSCLNSSFTQQAIAGSSPSKLPANKVNSTTRSGLEPTLDGRVQGVMARQKIAGMAVIVVQNGQVNALKGYGFADTTTKQPVTPNTVFQIGSMTKAFTAAAIMLLVEEGKVSLDAPIDRYLKNLPQAWQPLTLRQLLSHTSGLPDYSDNIIHKQREMKSPTDFIAIEGKQPLDFPTGESWSYSNSGFYLAGMIIERASGQRYGDFLRDRIFKPLNMQQTQAKIANVPNLATGYDAPRQSDDDIVCYAAGNILSTAIDMAKWAQALQQRKLLSAKSYQTLWTPVRLKNGRRQDYGLGWFLPRPNGDQHISHNGLVNGFASAITYDPRQKLSVVVLTNSEKAPATLIARTVTGLYEPSIGLVEQLTQTPRLDPNPNFTQKILALIQGKEKSIPFAPELLLQEKTRRGQESREYRKSAGLNKVQKIEFLKVIPQYDDRVYFYRMIFNKETYYMTVTVTPQQQIADYGWFQLP
jgi:D-alanyl-D-alanine carboxypeptidase